MIVEPQTKAELEDALASFARKKVDVLAISGGDGTIRDVLTRGAPFFGEDWPRIIILPQGKTNALALDLGLPGKWSLTSALDAAQKAQTVVRRPLVVEQCDGDQRQRYGFIFGAGIFNAAIDAGQVAHRYGAFQSFAVGMTAVFGVLQALFGIGDSLFRRPAKMTIRLGAGGEELAHSGYGKRENRLLAGFSSLTTFPLGLRPFARMQHFAGINYFVLDAPLRRAVALFPSALFGADFPALKTLGFHRNSTDQFTIELEENFILDGESFPPGTYRVRPGSEMHFVVP